MLRKSLLLACFIVFTALGYAHRAAAQYDLNYFVRPTSYSDAVDLNICGDANYVTSTTNFSGVYTGKSGNGPILTSPGVLSVSGVASSPDIGNQTSTGFTFSTISGSPYSITVNYSVLPVNTTCAVMQIKTSSETYYVNLVNSSTPTANPNCSLTACSYSLPATAGGSDIQVNFAVQAPDPPYNSTSLSDITGSLYIYDLWITYNE